MRTSVLGALTLALPVLPLLALGPAGPAGPAVAATDQDPRWVELTLDYDCEALGESGVAEVFARMQLPRTVRAGTKMAARTLDLTIVVPEQLVQTMREAGVERISGESRGATYSVGPHIRRIRDLQLPLTDVPPPDELMVVQAQGVAQAVRLEETRTEPVRLPGELTAEVDLEGAASATVDLACSLVQGERRKIGSVKVVP